MKKRYLLLAVALLLCACGFHLRGTVSSLPEWLTTIAIVSKDNNLEFNHLMTAQLEAYNIRVAANPASAPYWLLINAIHYKKQIVSIGSSTNPRQYHLILSIDFLVQTPKGELIAPEKEVIATRQLTVNNDRILGSDDEERILTNEMKQDAVIQIIHRLSTL